MMNTPIQTINLAGRRYVVIEESIYEKLSSDAGRAVGASDLPALPKPDKNGRFPALEYTRISMARSLIRDRRAAGLSQQKLAELSGVRQETISRLESGKHTPATATINKLDKAIEKANRRR